MRTAAFIDDQGWQLPLLVSDVIPPEFRHGFTTRGGGVSRAPYDTLNLGARWGDAAGDVVENRRRVERAAGGPLHVATQVHGAEVAYVEPGVAAAELAGARADALCGREAGVAVAVFVADCIPALLADPRTGAFAAVHAGWRGTVAGVLPAAVRALGARFGARPEDLRVALGPAIGPCCFEVGPEVVAAFEAALPTARAAGVIVAPAAGGGGAKARVDLKRANAVQLAAAGVRNVAIDAGPECTMCDRERFYSYRREGGRTGQHLAFIARAAGRSR
jgi:YfiH family protein